MKKLLIASLVAITVLALGGAAVAYAGSTQRPGGPGGFGPGPNGAESPLHDLMTSAWADALGLDAGTLQARLDDGERLSDIAAEAGIEGEDFFNLMQEIRDSVIEQAVADGLIEEGQFGQGGFGHGGKGHMGGGFGPMMNEGPLHDLLISGFADALGMDAETLQARLDGGETLMDIAEAQGYSLEDARDLFAEVRQSVFDQAVADGLIEPGKGGGHHGPGGPFGGPQGNTDPGN